MEEREGENRERDRERKRERERERERRGLGPKGAALFLPCVGLTSFWLSSTVHISTVWPILNLANFRFVARGQAVTAGFGSVCPFGSEGGTEHHGADPTIGPVMGKARDFGIYHIRTYCLLAP